MAAYRFLTTTAWTRAPFSHRTGRKRRHGRAASRWFCACRTRPNWISTATSARTGPLSYEAQRGIYRHPTYAVTPERVPLGILNAWMWAREKKDASGRRAGPKESQVKVAQALRGSQARPNCV